VPEPVVEAAPESPPSEDTTTKIEQAEAPEVCIYLSCTIDLFLDTDFMLG
jgi:hypothetical protein